MKIIMSALVIMSLVFSLVSAESVEGESRTITEHATKEIQMQTKALHKPTVANSLEIANETVEDTELDENFIIEHLERDLTEEMVVSLFGQPNASGINAMDARPTWRYDFTKNPDYKFEEFADFQEMGIVDAVAIEGLQSGEMVMQLFIGWTDEGRVHNFTLYQAGDGGTVEEYRVLADGSIRESSFQ